MKQHEEVLVQLKAEIEAMEGEEGEVQARLMDLRHELERYSAKMKENQQKIKHFQNEVGKRRRERGGRGGEEGRGRWGKNGREGCMWRGRVSQQMIKHFQNEVGEWRGEEKGRGRRKGRGEGKGRGRGRGKRKGREEGEERVEGSGGVGREWKGRVHVERSCEHVWERRDIMV